MVWINSAHWSLDSDVYSWRFMRAAATYMGGLALHKVALIVEVDRFKQSLGRLDVTREPPSPSLFHFNKFRVVPASPVDKPSSL